MPITATVPQHLLGAWRADPTHSSIAFAVRHMVVSTFRGEVADFDARLDAGESAISLSGSGRVASVVTRDETLTAHLFSPDFFDADRHPELGVVAESLELEGDEVTATAAVTIRGITRPVALRGSLTGPVEDPFGNTRLGIRLEAALDRREFGLEWNLPLPGGELALGNEVKVVAELELVKEA